jgi:hypothetical protein
MTTVTVNIPDHLLPLLDTIGDELPLVLEMGASRVAPISTKAYEETITFLTQNPTPKMVVDFRFSAIVETRIQALLRRQKQGQLTHAEEVELERLGQLEEQLQLMKAKALLELNKA